MRKPITPSAMAPAIAVEEAADEVRASFERLCLTAGLATLGAMMEEDAARLCGPRYGRGGGKDVYRWGKAQGKIGFHGGKIAVERPRVRAREGGEMTLPSWEAALGEDLLGRWAVNLMLMNVSTRKFARAVRLPGGDVPCGRGAGVSRSAVSRRFVALSAEKMTEWMSADLSKLDLLVIQIDGIHIDQDLVLLAAVGVDGNGDKHPLGVMEGASENAAVCQALINNLVGRGLEREAPGVSASILEGHDEILTVTRLGLPRELRRALACTNIIENMNGTIRRVCRNVKRWRDASMALHWTGAAMIEAAKGFRRLKAHKQLPYSAHGPRGSSGQARRRLRP